MSKPALRLIRSAVTVFPIVFMIGCALADEMKDGAHTRIQFDARATQLVENDAMRATLFVEVGDSTPTGAASRVTRAANEALRQLRRDKDLQVRTGAYRSYPTSDKGNITGWRARSELIIESEKPARVSAAIASVSDIMQLSSVAFYVSQKLRDKVETALEDQAVKAFLNKAQRIAESFGATQYQVAEATVMNEGGASPPQPIMRAMAADAATVAPEFGSGSTRLSVTVSGAILIAR